MISGFVMSFLLVVRWDELSLFCAEPSANWLDYELHTWEVYEDSVGAMIEPQVLGLSSIVLMNEGAVAVVVFVVTVGDVGKALCGSQLPTKVGVKYSITLLSWSDGSESIIVINES